MTEEQLAKLPKWAQDEFGRLKHNREAAIRALKSALDRQTPSPFFCKTYVCTNERGKGPDMVVAYFDAPWMSVEFEGVHLDIHLRQGEGISVKWNRVEAAGTDPVVMTPTSFQQIALSAPPFEKGDPK